MRVSPFAGEIDSRHRRSDQQGYQRICEEGGEFPELEHEGSPARGQRQPQPSLPAQHPKIAHHDAGRHGRKHAGGAEALCEEERRSCGSSLAADGVLFGEAIEAEGALGPELTELNASALLQTEDTGIGASFSKIALAEVVHVKGRQSLLWALM